MKNIVEMAKQRFSNELIEFAALKLNEKASHIKKSVDASLSILYLTLLQKIEQKKLKKILGPEQKRFNLKEIDLKEPICFFEVELSNPNKGIVGNYGNLLPLLFDDKADPMIDRLSGYAKIKSISGHHILVAVTALLLSLINKNYDLAHENSVISYLANQKNNIQNNLPDDALFYETFDFSDLKEFQERKSLKKRIIEKIITKNNYFSKKQLLLYFLLVLFLINLIWLLFIRKY